MASAVFPFFVFLERGGGGGTKGKVSQRRNPCGGKRKRKRKRRQERKEYIYIYIYTYRICASEKRQLDEKQNHRGRLRLLIAGI